MSCTAFPHEMLLEDANDLCEFLTETKRTIPVERWVPEVAVELQNEIDSKANQGLL